MGKRIKTVSMGCTLGMFVLDGDCDLSSDKKVNSQQLTAPTSNWRLSGLLKICAGIKFSDIFEM